MKLDTLLKQGVGADDQLRATIGDCFQGFSPCGGALAAAEPGSLNAEWPKPVGEAAPMLFGENLGRRHDRCLYAAGDALTQAIAATTVLPEPTSP